jgi:hypothetical protein
MNPLMTRSSRVATLKFGVYLIAAALLCYVDRSVASGQDAVKDAPSPADTATKKSEQAATEKLAKKVNTIVAAVAPLRLTAELDAVVDSAAKYEINLRPKSLKELKLIGSLGHSQRVSRGQLVPQVQSHARDQSPRRQLGAFTGL